MISNPLKIVHPLRLTTAVFFLIVAFLSSGCAANKSLETSGVESYDVTRVVVVPFENMSVRFGENSSVSNPLTRKVFVTGAVVEGAEVVVAGRLHDILMQDGTYEIVPPEAAKEVMADISAAAVDHIADRQLLIRTGKHFNADTVLTGRLYRFIQRVGSGYGIESPASVAFDLVALNVDTGKVIWRGHLDETQRSLAENLFSLGSFLKRKGRWVTAEEMAEIALSEMVASLPD